MLHHAEEPNKTRLTPSGIIHLLMKDNTPVSAASWSVLEARTQDLAIRPRSRAMRISCKHADGRERIWEELVENTRLMSTQFHCSTGIHGTPP